MKATEIKNLFRDVDTFTFAYIEAALWSTHGPAFGVCPCCEQPGKLLDRWPEEKYERQGRSVAHEKRILNPRLKKTIAGQT